jgi:multidrug efflux pump subunit AcrA (membrane-fusion protein)
VFDIEVTLDSQGKELRTGMTANVTIKGDRAEKVLAVPVESVFRREDGEVVYVKKAPAGKKGEGKGAKTAVAEAVPAKGEKTEAKATPKATPKADPKATPDPRDVWKKTFEERKVETGLSSMSHTQIVAGLKEGEEVALEDPTKPKKKEENR